jgi:hypothetical protein
MSATRSLALALVWGVAACSQNPAPAGWLAPPRQAQSDPYGAWIVVWQPAPPDLRGEVLAAQGEFLAVDRDSVYVLSPDSVVRAVPVGTIHSARIAFYDAQSAGLGIWTGVGSVSTISNGGFLVLTLPLWVIGGSLITGGQSRAPLRDVQAGDSWDVLRRYARFPQGLPEGLPRRLRTKG